MVKTVSGFNNLTISNRATLNTVVANGNVGTAGQLLTSNGSTTYWSTVTAGSVNTSAQYTWTNLHTFSANVAFTGNGIGLTTNTAAIYLGGLADNNWKIGRNTGSTTKWRYTNNSIDVITANSNLEGFAIGLISGNSYFETGYLGTFIAANVTIGNSSSNSTINSTAFSGSANNTTYVNGKTEGNLNVNSALTSNNSSFLGGTAAASYQLNSTLNANIASYLPTYTGIVNGSSHTVGTSFTANSTVTNTVSLVVSTNTATIGTGTYFVSNGNVGIGTSSPAKTLEILNTSNNYQIRLSANSSSYSEIGHFTDGYLHLNSTGSRVIIDAAYLDTSAGTILLGPSGFGTTGDVVFRSTGAPSSTISPVFRIKDSTGVSVDGIKFAPTWVNSTSGSYQTIVNVSSLGVTFASINTVANTNTSVISWYGNIGVGNTAPTHKLRVEGTASVTANLNVEATGELVIAAGAGIYANGGLGSAGEVLHSNGSSVYWAADDNAGGTVTSVATGSGLSGGPITTTGTVSVLANNGITANTTGLFVTQGTGTVVNSSGVHVNSAYIGTLSANNTTYVNGKTEGNLNVNSALTSNNSSFLGGNSASDLRTYSDNKAANAYSNAVSYVDGKSYVNTSQLSSNLSNYQTTAGLAGNVALLAANSATYLGNSSGTIANVSSWITTNAAAAYTNAVSYTDSKILTANAAITGNATTAYTNAVSYTDGKILTANAAITGNAATAYTNAIAFASNASNINTGTLAEARLPFRMNQNLTTSNSVTFGSLTLTGNLTVSGNVTVIGANALSVVDNMIYLNANNTTQNIDVGIVANYNSGAYAHTGIFRDASDGYWKVFDSYLPEPDANVNIDTTNTSFHLADFQANTFYAGNTSTNWFIANTAGVYHTGLVNAASFRVGTSTISNSTGVYTGVVNGSSITIGTAFTANATVVNAVSYYAGSTLIGNTTGPYGKTEGNLNVNNALTSNNSSFLGGTAAASYQLNSTLNANIASYLPTYTGIVNGSSHTVGTSFTANSTVVNAVSYYAGTTLIANSTGPYGKIEGNLNVNNATTAYGKTESNLNVNSALTSNNSTNLGGTAAASYQLNSTLNANIASYLPTYTGVVNGSSHTVGTSFTANATVVNAVSYYAGTTLIGNTTGPYGKTEGSLNVNNATTAYGKTEGNLNVNSATQATNATNLNSQPSSFYTNATNITTGTLPYAQIPANIINTTAAFTISGIHTYNANIVLGSSGLSANGSFGTAGHVLHSNGTATYWAADDNAGGTVTSVASGNGITGGTITTTGTLTAVGGAGLVVNTSGINVLANTGIVANSTGTFVNATYIGTLSANNASFLGGTAAASYQLNSTLSANVATLSANNASFLGGTAAASYQLNSTLGANIASYLPTYTGVVNGSSHTVGTSFTANSTLTNTVSLVVSTNTATIGTGTYFVANGNVGIGTASPVYKLEVSGSFAATTKSFVIDHPSKKGMKLRHGSLEGPENGVYVRGRTNTNIIELPDYWVKLIDKDSITVSLTAIGKTVCPSVGKITNKKINLIGNDIDCFFHVFAERKDVEKLVVEY